MMGDPVVDGARGDVEYLGQFGVGGAEQAILAREVAMIGAIARRASGWIHKPNISTPVIFVNNQSYLLCTRVFACQRGPIDASTPAGDETASSASSRYLISPKPVNRT